MMTCPHCQRGGFEEGARALFRRDPRELDLFCCTCTSVLVVRGARLVDATDEDILEMNPTAYAVLWRTRQTFLESMRHLQGGSV